MTVPFPIQCLLTAINDVLKFMYLMIHELWISIDEQYKEIVFGLVVGYVAMRIVLSIVNWIVVIPLRALVVRPAMALLKLTGMAVPGGKGGAQEDDDDGEGGEEWNPPPKRLDGGSRIAAAAAPNNHSGSSNNTRGAPTNRRRINSQHPYAGKPVPFTVDMLAKAKSNNKNRSGRGSRRT